MAKDEIIKVYDLKDPERAVPMSRIEYYDEQIEEYARTGKSSKAVEIISIFLFNSDGELIIQKRSDNKNHNPGLLDKSIGGHVRHDDSVDFTTMVETVQELQVPSITLRSDEDFQKAYELLKGYLNTVALVKHISSKIIHLERIVSKKKFVHPNKVNLFFGVFDGAIKMIDKEAKGIMFYSLDDLKKEMDDFPGMFTYDLKYLIHNFEADIGKFISEITKKRGEHES